MNSIEQIPSGERTRIEKCLASGLSGGSDVEAIAAINSARRILTRHKLTVYDYYRQQTERGGGVSADIAPVRNHQIEKENLNLRREVATLNDRISELSIKLERASVSSAPVGAHQPKSKDGFYTYEDWYRALVLHLNTTKRAQAVFASSAGIQLERIQSWKRSDRVPADMFDLIPSIDPELTSKRPQPLTGAHKRRIDSLAVEGKTDAEIAEIMNLEFADRSFDRSSVKGAKKQARLDYLKGLRFDGVTREEALRQFTNRYSNARPETMFNQVYGK